MPRPSRSRRRPFRSRRRRLHWSRPLQVLMSYDDYVGSLRSSSRVSILRAQLILAVDQEVGWPVGNAAGELACCQIVDAALREWKFQNSTATELRDAVVTQARATIDAAADTRPQRTETPPQKSAP